MVSPHATSQDANKTRLVEWTQQLYYSTPKTPLLRNAPNLLRPSANCQSTNDPKAECVPAELRSKRLTLTTWRVGQDAKPRQALSDPWSPREGPLPSNSAGLRGTTQSQKLRKKHCRHVQHAKTELDLQSARGLLFATGHIVSTLVQTATAKSFNAAWAESIPAHKQNEARGSSR